MDPFGSPYPDFGDAPEPAPAPDAAPADPGTLTPVMPEPAPIQPPVVESPAQATKRRLGAGAAIVLSGSATIAGALAAGWYGAGAGLFGMGSAQNLLRAYRLWGSTDSTERGEAAKSATLGVLGAGLSGYLIYLATRKKERKPA